MKFIMGISKMSDAAQTIVIGVAVIFNALALLSLGFANARINRRLQEIERIIFVELLKR